MLESCLKEAHKTGAKDSQDEEYLKLLRQKPVTKLSQLEARCLNLQFSASQKFFQHFIANSTYGFIVHFKEVLVKSILNENENVDVTKNNAEIVDSILR